MRRENETLIKHIEEACSVFNELERIESDLKDLAEEVGERHPRIARYLSDAHSDLGWPSFEVEMAMMELMRCERGNGDEEE